MKPNTASFPGSEIYFAHFTEGRFDELSRLCFIYPTSEARLSDDGLTLNIGRPGVDGLEFSFRMGKSGIWVWYPLDDEWRKVAPDVTSLEQDWLAGNLKV